MRKFELVKPECRRYECGKLPTRNDKGSAGYDFYAPVSFSIAPGETYLLMTDIKAQMEKDEVLLLYVRSSIGIKKHLMLANGTGIIDSSYYNNPDNDGNIGLALTNYGQETQHITLGDRIAQGIFINYLTTKDDKPLSEKRKGGIGSTGK
ncbi:MAG: dUTPase [Clostridia bacterium]|nr:dUTPase [Clostridia bacterium]